MNQRKLIKLGNSSYAIALPKDWIDKAGLKKGDNVFLEENSGGEIVLWSRIKKFPDEKIKEISMEDDMPKIRKEVIAAYINGYTSIIFTPIKDREKKKEVKDFISSLLGFEVIDDGDKGVVSKDFFDISEAKIDNFIKRMDNNLTECFEMLASSFQTGGIKKSEYEEISNTDRDTTRFYMLISRLFFKGTNNPSILNALKKDSFTFFNNWWFAQNLEHIGDIVKELSCLVYKSNTKKEKVQELHEVFLKIFDCYKGSIEVVNSNDKTKAILCAKRGKEVSSQCDKLAQERDSTVAKLAIKFKELETAIYQNLKIIIYLRENDRSN